jgi:hypothetical protein
MTTLTTPPPPPCWPPGLDAGLTQAITATHTSAPSIRPGGLVADATRPAVNVPVVACP